MKMPPTTAILRDLSVNFVTPSDLRKLFRPRSKGRQAGCRAARARYGADAVGHACAAGSGVLVWPATGI